MSHSADIHAIVMQSPFMRRAAELLRLYMGVNRPILLVGPVGSGKTTLAREVWRASGQSGPFVAIGCGEFDPNLYNSLLFGHVPGSFTGASDRRSGLVVEAAHGALLLDDLPFMPLVAQASLLRLLESRSYRPVGGEDQKARCRILFASTVEPRVLVGSGRLLADLKSRVGELIVRIPPLSVRRESIPALAVAFAESLLREERYRGSVQFTESALALLDEYPWPENVRELRGVAERAVIHAGLRDGEILIEAAHLPDHLRFMDPDDQSPEAAAKSALIRSAVEAAGGNQTKAAAYVRKHRNTVSKYMRPRR